MTKDVTGSEVDADWLDLWKTQRSASERRAWCLDSLTCPSVRAAQLRVITTISVQELLKACSGALLSMNWAWVSQLVLPSNDAATAEAMSQRTSMPTRSRARERPVLVLPTVGTKQRDHTSEIMHDRQVSRHFHETCQIRCLDEGSELALGWSM